MTFLQLLLLIVCIIYVLATRVLPKIISWYFEEKLHCKVSIGSIGLPSLSFKNVCFEWKGYTVHVDNISLSSSFVNSDVTKLLSVMLHDVSVKKDVGVAGLERSTTTRERKVLDFRNKTVPSKMVTIAQFLGIYIYNVNIMLLHVAFPEWLLHATADEIKLDGTSLRQSTLSIAASIATASAKVLEHKQGGTSCQPCLGEVSFALNFEAVLNSTGLLSVQNIRLLVEQPQARVDEDFFSFLERHQSLPLLSTGKGQAIKYDDGSILSTSLQHFLPLVPVDFEFRIEKSSVKLVDGHSHNMNASVGEFSFAGKSKVTLSEVLEVNATLSIQDIKVECGYNEILRVGKISWETQFDQLHFNTNLQLVTFSTIYDHAELLSWLRPLSGSSSPRQSQSSLHRFSHYLSGRNFDMTVELWDVSVVFRLGGETKDTSAGFSHKKFTLCSDDFGQGMFLTSKTEIVVETLWCATSSSSGEWGTKKRHVWGSPVFVSYIMIHLQPGIETDLKVKAVLDTLRLEWSPRLAVVMTQIFNCFELSPSPIKSKGSGSASTCAVSINISDTNLFCIGKNDLVTMLRIDTCSLEKQVSSETTNVAMIYGAKVMFFNRNNFVYKCQKAAELKGGLADLSHAEITYDKAAAGMKIELHSDVHVTWSLRLHLHMMNVLEDILEFKAKVTKPSSMSSAVKQKYPFTLCSEHRITLGLTFAPSRRLDVILDGLQFSKLEENIAVSLNDMKVRIDNHDILMLEKPCFSCSGNVDLLQDERKMAPNLMSFSNRAWFVVIQTCRIRFPYNYNFSEAFNDKFLSVFKWLKMKHRRIGEHANTLPSDISLKITHLTVQLDDDPFEVKLRDNYELLEDEHHESLKRQKMLDAKVEELRKTHLLLPTGKVDELYASLSKKNAEIYIQRSRQMYKAASVRRHLFLWHMENVDICAMADASMHGVDNVVSIIKEIDAESPWPEDDLPFSTIWCRAIRASWKTWKIQLRDFPQPLLDVCEMHLWGRLAAAEPEASKRARRECVIEIGEPYGDVILERGMAPLKFYHDLSFDVDKLGFAYGPCWEPVIAQCNLGFDKITSPPRDPSLPMPFWDKVRLLLHGRLTLGVQQLTLYLHASLDPYNTTEEMALTWTDMVMDWTNGKFVFKGDFSINVKTASKYDDCRLMHLPNLKLTVKLDWQCLGDPCDHHAVTLCARDKLPEYSSNQEHDSYRSFRSQHLNAGIVLETKSRINRGGESIPTALLYGSTLRWFENLKLILSGVTRPTRRGLLFRNVKPRKLSLSRHYRKVRLSVSFHRFHICYWMSFAMQRGFELVGGRLSSSSEHALVLVPITDGLKHRPRADWSVSYMNCELNDAEIWLQSVLQEENMSLHPPVEKYYFLSVTKVSYGRETFESSRRDTPAHRLVIHDMKGAWTKSNRDVTFALFDSFVKAQQLKSNLSPNALKWTRTEGASSPSRNRNRTDGISSPTDRSLLAAPASTATPSPLTKLQTGHAAYMLQKLIAEADNNSVVFSEDQSAPSREEHLQGVPACQTDDVQHKNWLVELVNSQVLLKGCETKGYVILSAAKAQILQRVHRPVWRDHSLVSKTTWVGSLECMQYYATVNADDNDSLNENIMWLTVDNIQEKDSVKISDLPDLVGSGQSVGGVVSETVGATSNEGGTPTIQLQRIASRCKCEFFYVSYGETSLDPSAVPDAPPPPSDNFREPDLWEKQEEPVDAFTLMHHDLNVCTNSLQYAMILDIVNNLLLHTEPKRKEASERLQRMRFQLQLCSVDDQRKPIQQFQSHVRSIVSQLRRTEKEAYLVQRSLVEDPANEALARQLAELEAKVYECKEYQNAQAEELSAMISCYKETQVTANQKLAATTRGNKPVTVIRVNEICFKHAQWRLTETDGQLGISDIVLSNFLYTKKSKADDAVEHLLELGYVNMTNLLPNQLYKDVLSPTEIQSTMPVDRQRSLRVFCREKAPVGGISVKEHFEINVVPITIGMTHQFFKKMLAFCFPEKDPESIDMDEDDTESKSSRKGKNKRKESSFYVAIEEKDDVEKMKERAAMNKLFIYIKIPEVPVKVSYKGEKDKNIEDVHEFSLVIPTLEYHNVTWTWLDLLLAMKNDSKRVLVSQAIKLKLQIRPLHRPVDETNPQEEDKARILLGSKLMGAGGGGGKALKKSLFKSSK